MSDALLPNLHWLHLPETKAELELLSDDELARMRRLRSDDKQHEFAATRSTLRRLLGNALNTSPAALIFDVNEQGKPRLAGEYSDAAVSFNVSHSGNYSLIAIANDRIELGVDVERLRFDVDVPALATRYFADSEAAALMELNGEAQQRAFFQVWTRKEALLKARGSGFWKDSRSFAVAIDVGPSQRVHFEDSDWLVQAINAPEGYLAALAFSQS